MSKGVHMKPLLESAIFNYVFDFTEWPGSHSNLETIIRPFNGNLQSLRHQYSTIFNDLWKKEEQQCQDRLNHDGYQKVRHNHEKQFSIRYTVNLLPAVDENTEYGTIISNLV